MRTLGLRSRREMIGGLRMPHNVSSDSPDRTEPNEVGRGRFRDAENPCGLALLPVCAPPCRGFIGVGLTAALHWTCEPRSPVVRAQGGVADAALQHKPIRACHAQSTWN